MDCVCVVSSAKAIPIIELYLLVKWGKEQPKITNLALTPQP